MMFWSKQTGSVRLSGWADRKQETVGLGSTRQSGSEPDRTFALLSLKTLEV